MTYRTYELAHRLKAAEHFAYTARQMEMCDCTEYESFINLIADLRQQLIAELVKQKAAKTEADAYEMTYTQSFYTDLAKRFSDAMHFVPEDCPHIYQ